MTIEGKRLCLVHIYAPNRDDPNFFKQLKQHILEADNTNILIVGDWKLILEPEVDGTNYKTVNNQNAKVDVCNMNDCRTKSLRYLERGAPGRKKIYMEKKAEEQYCTNGET